MIYGSRMADKKVRKIEKLVETTTSLHSALEALAEMEISERKLKQWKMKQKETMVQKETIDVFYQKLENQRREVRYFMEISLWSKDFDKIVDLMAKIVCVVYARISQVSGNRKKSTVREKILPFSGPILPTSKPTVVRFYSRRIDERMAMTTNKVLHSAGPRTVGGSGLAMRYANVILLAAEYLDATTEISQGARDSLYEMLPENLKAMVGAKLSKNMRGAEGDRTLAEGWREAVEEMMRWLEPMARDTVTWQMERSLEKVRMEEGKAVGKRKTAVVMAQTLHFADKEKTEAVIAEVLVGLSCIFRFENRQFRD